MQPRYQPAILEPVPALARFLELDLRPNCDAKAVVTRLREVDPKTGTIVGVGAPLALAAGASVPGLRPFPSIAGPGCAFPAAQRALWVCVAGADPTELHDRSRSIRSLLGDALILRDEVTCFKYAGGRDLSGYEDGTENPKGERAVEVAILRNSGPGLDGGSFVAAQKWVHDLAALSRLTAPARDHVMGRNRTTNEEIADAPPSAHVKRAAQETYDPPACMLRRSMPWGGTEEHGLYFVAFGESSDRFERVLRRMSGADDGIPDALLTFTRAVAGGYYFCPPLDGEDRIDVSALGT